MKPLRFIQVCSFGYKYGPPPLANMLYDMRFVKNPYYVEELRPMTGADQPVADFILEQDVSKRFLARLSDQLTDMVSGWLDHGHDHETVTIAFGCTGGKHRSVCFAVVCLAILHDVVAKLSPQTSVELIHRDLGRE